MDTCTNDLSAGAVMERCDTLASYSEEPGCLTRPFATPSLRGAADAVAGWMRAAGMSVRRDNIGNVIGRYEAAHAGAKTMLLGSHLDTVRDAGKYDGALGVLVALACVERLHARRERLPVAVEVIGFADEEGLRYHSTYLGSSAVAGTFDPDQLSLTDADGITLADAIRAAGGDPDALAGDRRRPADLLGYCEVHIEQGPVLERLDLPIGVVSAIAGQSRIGITVSGAAGHAGTVPMEVRRDALCAAAEVVLGVEALGRSRAGLIATVGQMEVQPGASNVIPGQVTLSLDVRHPDDAAREAACRDLQEQARRICAQRHVALDWRVYQQSPAVTCDPGLSRVLAQAIEAQGYRVTYLASGAGHDGVAISALTPIAMLFVRCQGGISHHPAESVSTADVAVAIEVLSRFLTRLPQDREAS